tara:strand:- start:5 stop:310 length:306 start_codon:yes stop_codon:yes gene_type:complete
VFCDYRIHPYINCILFVSISFTVISTKLWKSNYSPYQEELYKKIGDLKDNVFTPLGYRKIFWIFGFFIFYHLTYLLKELYLNGLNGTEQQKTIGFLSFGGD